MTLDLITFTAPSSWASALINGDASGLDEAETQAIDACLADLLAEHGSAHICDCTEAEFRNRPGDYGDLAGDYSTYSMLV